MLSLLPDNLTAILFVAKMRITNAFTADSSSLFDEDLLQQVFPYATDW
jgi:hypothetical protein